MVDEPTEPSDIWMHPFTDEIDRKLKPIKSEIKKLKKAQPEVFAKLIKELLYTQRELANFVIANTSTWMIHLLPENHRDVFAQVTAKAATARAKVSTSNDPLEIAGDFYSNCSDILETASGKKMIRLS